jgi:hypothetical protein
MMTDGVACSVLLNKPRSAQTTGVEQDQEEALLALGSGRTPYSSEWDRPRPKDAVHSSGERFATPNVVLNQRILPHGWYVRKQTAAADVDEKNEQVASLQNNVPVKRTAGPDAFDTYLRYVLMHLRTFLDLCGDQ